ncbi:MAG: TolC family protein [Myxococcales bacterium]|nr:TolC family protein [Myxococcales bacterium]
MIPMMVVAAALAAPGVLTLEQAQREANQRNADLGAARARLDQARELSSKAWAGYLPQLTAGGAYTYNSVEAKIALPTGYYIRNVYVPQGPEFDPSREPGIDNPPGAPTPYLMVPSGLMEAVIQKQHQFAGQVQLGQAVVAPALWFAIANAGRAEDLSELSIEAARREVLFGATRLYYGAVGLEEATALQERLLQANAEHEKDAKVRFEAGAAPKIAWLRAQIERARSEQDVKRTRIAFESAKSALAALLDRDPDFEVERPEPPELSAPVERAPLDERPDVLAARQAVELAEGNRRMAWAKYAPNLGLFARYQAANAKGFTGEYGAYVAGLSLNWTLWDGGLREAELREADAKVAEARESLRAVEARAKDEVRRALLDLESARANRVKAEEQAKLARENAALVKANFEAGAATYLEVTDANSALLGAELAGISESLGTELAALQLLKAAGRFDPLRESPRGARP